MNFLIFATFFNLWIYKIFISNFFLGVLLLVATLLLYKNLTKKDKKVPIPLILCFILVLFFQVRTTQSASLFSISNDDRRVIDMRLRAYPPSFLRIGHWVEERKESIAFFRVAENLFENLDPNLYFFANHPRERVGIKEFEKFPYILLPLFFLGMLNSVSNKKKWFWPLAFVVPLILLSIVGNMNSLGPFSLFPFFIISISGGLNEIFKG